MEIPEIKIGQWITVGGSTDAYVLNIVSEIELEIGYLQNGSKAIKEPVEFIDGAWAFKYSGPNGSYLRGQEASVIKRGRY